MAYLPIWLFWLMLAYYGSFWMLPAQSVFWMRVCTYFSLSGTEMLQQPVMEWNHLNFSHRMLPCMCFSFFFLLAFDFSLKCSKHNKKCTRL